MRIAISLAVAFSIASAATFAYLMTTRAHRAETSQHAAANHEIVLAPESN